MKRLPLQVLLVWPAWVVALTAPALALSSYRYDAENHGYLAETVNLPLTLLWKHSTELIEDPVIATPCVGEDAVYFCIQQKVFALDRKNGDIKWERDTGTKLFSTPVYHEGRLYFGAQDSHLWVLNAATGHPEWKFKLGGPIDCPPLIVGNMLYVGCDDDSLHAIDITRQGEIWAFGTRGDIKAAPAFSRGNIYFASRDEYLYCIDANGNQRWRAKLSTEDNFSAPVVSGDRGLLFVASGHSLHCFDAQTRNSRWKPFSAGDLIVGSPALAPDRKVYVGSKDGAVYCISALNGQAIWKYPPGANTSIEPILSSPTVLDDEVLLVRTGPKLLAALNRQTGELRWEYRLETPPEKEKKQKVGTPGGMMMPGMMGGMMGGEPGMMMPEEMEGMGAGGEMGMAPGGEEGGRRGGRRGGLDMGEGGMPGGRVGGGEEHEPAEFEESLRASLMVAEGAAYVVGDCGALYAFDPIATDETPPFVSEAVLDITGKDKYRFLYGLTILDGDAPANRYADSLTVPGLPPIRLTFDVMDEGAGINPGSVELRLNDKKLDVIYDSVGSQVLYILDPERGPARPLPDGPSNFVLRLRDWHGNQAVGQVSFTVDNSLPPLEHKQAGGMMMPGMGEGMEGSMMEPGMMGPGMMGPGMMGPGMMGPGMMQP
jgi:outer membrane protein assembly factor BamB